MRDAIVLGCGYTGTRVAARLLTRGVRVLAASRSPADLSPLSSRGASIVALDATRPGSLAALAAAAAGLAPGFGIVCSVPPVERDGELADATEDLLAACGRPGRVVYLSSTAVYGGQETIDGSSGIAPATRSAALRVAAERTVAAGPWSSLVLRPAAIYGPGRGLHASGGVAPRRAGDPDRIVSRIHVTDLAALCDAALASGLTGAHPVADRMPASTREVIAFCASLGLAVPALPPPRSDPAGSRRVDGRAVFEALGVAISYPSYREGILASLEGEPGSRSAR